LLAVSAFDCHIGVRQAKTPAVSIASIGLAQIGAQ
jgi:hypothetical protein